MFNANAMELLNFDILLNICKYLNKTDLLQFLEFLRIYHNAIFINICDHYNKSINKKYKTLDLIDTLFTNIDSYNNINSYMKIKEQLFKNHCITKRKNHINANIALITHYSNKLKNKKKIKFNNITSCFRSRILLELFNISDSIYLKNIELPISYMLTIKDSLYKI